MSVVMTFASPIRTHYNQSDTTHYNQSDTRVAQKVKISVCSLNDQTYDLESIFNGFYDKS